MNFKKRFSIIKLKWYLSTNGIDCRAFLGGKLQGEGEREGKREIGTEDVEIIFLPEES